MFAVYPRKNGNEPALTHPRANPQMVEFHSFRLDNVNQCLWQRRSPEEDREEIRVSLTPKTFAVLQYLVEHAGRLVSHSELLDTLWPDTFVQPEALKNHILDIRVALGDNAKNPKFIATLPTRGYRFIAPTHRASQKTSAEPDYRRLVGRSAEVAQLNR